MSGIKHYFKEACNKAAIKEPADWEWQDCMLEAKRKYPKSGVHKSVFKKWKDQYLDAKWKAWSEFMGHHRPRKLTRDESLKLAAKIELNSTYTTPRTEPHICLHNPEIAHKILMHNSTYGKFPQETSKCPIETALKIAEENGIDVKEYIAKTDRK